MRPHIKTVRTHRMCPLASNVFINGRIQCALTQKLYGHIECVHLHQMCPFTSNVSTYIECVHFNNFMI